MYILVCADGSYYTGSTWNLEKRLWEHQNGLGANYTQKRLPVKLVYCEPYDRVEDAFRREKQIQGWSRRKKQALIEGNIQNLIEFSRNYTQYGRPEERLPSTSLASTSLASTSSANVSAEAEPAEAEAKPKPEAKPSPPEPVGEPAEPTEDHHLRKAEKRLTMNSKATPTPSRWQLDDERIEIYESLTEARQQFGENYGGYVFKLTRAQIQALLEGKVVAFDISGREYAGFLMMLTEPGDEL
jgi:putative endonuclease